MEEETYDWDKMANVAFERFYAADPLTVAFDTETEGLAYYDRPFCVTLAWDDESHYIDIDWNNPGFVYRKKLVTEILEHSNLVAHNLKFDLQKLSLVKCLPTDLRINVGRFNDTDTMYHLLYPNADHSRVRGEDGKLKPGNKKLKTLAKVLLGDNTDEATALAAIRKVSRKPDGSKVLVSDGYYPLRRDLLVPYALKDAEFTLAIYNLLLPELEQHSDTLYPLYRQQMGEVLDFLDIEAAGMSVDVPYITNKIREYGDLIVEEQARIERYVGLPVGRGESDFNPASPKQLLEVFGERGHKLSGTGKEILETINDPLATSLLKLRGLVKTRTTYFEGVKNEQKNGIFHPNFRLNGTKTGRFSSGGAEA